MNLFEINTLGFDHVKRQHGEMVNEILRYQAEEDEKAEQLARRRFFRNYRIRSILFRLAPRMAARLVL